MKTVGLKLIFLFIIHLSYGQESSFWLYLKPDMPCAEVQQSLSHSLDIDYLGYSAWLHAVAIKGDASAIQKLAAVFPIEKIEKQGYFYRLSAKEDSVVYGFALEQMGAAEYTAATWAGEGVAIGVIDGGFLGADKSISLAHLFQQNKIKGYRDYVTPNMKPYHGAKANDDHHGTEVLQLIGGVNAATNVQHGLATAADYYLARTDDGTGEKRIEEYYLIQALEWMDSLGVKLVNVSLGYTEMYDDPAENYVPEQMDGSTAVARAVQIASEEKGMLIVVAAGNDGDRPWKILSAPADAAGALSVGSTKYRHWDKATFSSIGPDFLPYLKPEISCFAADGTSFSAPIITGLAALIWQKRPDFSSMEVKELILSSGHLYPFGNTYVGYGVPQFSKIARLLEGKEKEKPEVVKVAKKSFKIPVDIAEHLVLYHKTGTIRVWNEIYMTKEEAIRKIKRPKDIAYTTVIIDNSIVIELAWE